MKGMLWKKALAAAAALLIVSGNAPIKPVADMFGGMAITASADEEYSGECGDNAKWSLDDAGKLTISGMGEMYDYEYKKGVVTSQWYSYADEITSVVIENGVTSIGNYAFSGCTSLTSIEIPDSVESIGNSAFDECTSLTSITIPDSVESIGNSAFESCTGLTSIEIPDSVTSIGNSAFDECTSLTSVKMSKNVTSIGDYAFSDCSKLTSITIPDSVTSIGEKAFYNCISLTSITIPDSVTSIGDLAFSYCTNLTSVKMSKNVTSIGNSAFSDCTSLTSIKIPDSVTSIGNYVFCNCSKLTSITIPDSVESIGEEAFSGCESLTSITIPDSVTSIGEKAFSGCESLTSITIPVSVTSIGEEAFYGCTGIKDVYCYANPANLTWKDSYCDDFIETPPHTTVCYVPKEYLDTYTSETFSDVNVTFKAEAMDKCGDHAYWCFDSKTGKLTISGTGTMNDFEYGTRPWYDYKDNITSVVIENGVTSIGNSAFDGCAALTLVTISDSVTSIGQSAFESCTGLTSIEIPDRVTSIGQSAFDGCAALTSVTISDSVISIGNWAFSDCTSLTSIKIPDSVTSIGNYAFYNCSKLTSITIPDSVTSIGECVFYNCTSLESITIPVSVTSIGEDAFFNCMITDVYCYANPANLTWKDSYCDDFIETPPHTTVCYVPKEYLETYEENFGDVNVTFKAEATDKCGENAFWSFDSETGKLTISGTGAMYNYEDENDVVTSPWYNYADKITSVEIENGITSIGNYAFHSCKLTSITIPDSVTSIGECVFYHCTSLKSVTIPDGVKSIGGYAFSSCESLTSITIPDSVTSIGDYVFYNCTSLESITIPDSVESIGADAFYGCTGITDVYCYADPDKLTWNENGCDDFIKTPEHTTVCHVREEYLGKYNEKFGSSVNVTFAGDLDAVDMGLGEHLYGHSITLDGSIGVNFFVELENALLTSDTAKMVFTVPNGKKTETQTLLVKDVVAKDSNKVVIGSKTYYKFKCSISAKDMASTITAQLVDGDNAGTEYKYSVKAYADYLLSHTQGNAEYAKAAPLVKAMLNYGAYAQKYFNEGTAFEASESVVDVTIPNTFKYNGNASLSDGVTFEGATLSLKSETTLSLYFTGLPDNTTFACGDKEVKTEKNGSYVVARIRGIKAEELENNFTLTFTGGSVTYNAMTYCYNVLNGGSDNVKLQNVVKALYQYAEAASPNS